MIASQFLCSSSIMHKDVDSGKDQPRKRKFRTPSQVKKAVTTVSEDVVKRYLYAPLSEVRGAPVNRRTKRLIHFLKYKALGILKLPWIRIKITDQSDRSPVECPPPVEKYLSINTEPTLAIGPDENIPINQVITVKPITITFQDEFELIEEGDEEEQDDGTMPQSEVPFAVDDEHYDKYAGKPYEMNPAHAMRLIDLHRAIEFRQTRHTHIAIKNENGLELMFTSLNDIFNYCRKHWIKEPQMRLASGLVGGGREKNSSRRKRGKKKKNSRGRAPMITAGQLGLRNPPQMKANYGLVKEFWRYNIILETDGSGNISSYVSLRNPLTAVNGSGVYQRAQDLAQVYDEYKVLSTSLVLDFLVLNPVVGDIAISSDYDSIPSGTYTYGSLVDTQYARIFSGTNQITYTTKVPALTEGTYRERPAIIHKGGFYDFNTPPDEGFIALAFERFVPNNRLVRLTVMQKVLVRRRRTLNATMFTQKPK